MTYILKIINVCQDNVKHVSKIILRHFTKRCMESTASKRFIKRYIWLNLWAKFTQFFFVFECLYYATQYYRIYYLAAQQQNKLINFRFVLMWCAFQLRNSATVLQEAHTNSIFSRQQFSVLEYYTARNIISCLAAQSAIQISVAFFYEVAVFSDFNRLFELLGPGFAPYSNNAFYILE